MIHGIYIRRKLTFRGDPGETHSVYEGEIFTSNEATRGQKTATVISLFYRRIFKLIKRKVPPKLKKPCHAV